MGVLGEIFGVTRSQPSGGVFDSLFGGTPTPTAPPSSPFSSGEPIMPAASQARGYGGQMFGSVSAADKSRLIDGVVTDPDTGYVGRPAQIYDRYRNEGRCTDRLVQRYQKW